MSVRVTHTAVVAAADDGTSEVGSNEWNADHTIAGLGAGTSFPGSPAAGDQFFRTDLGLDCYYDGSQWLTKQQFEIGGTGTAGGVTGISATSAANARMPVRIDYPIYLTRWVVTTFVNATNTGSAFWTVGLERYSGANVTNNVTSFSTGTGPDTASNWVSHGVNINAALDSSARELVISVTKTSTAGNLFYTSALYYRLIVT